MIPAAGPYKIYQRLRCFPLVFLPAYNLVPALLLRWIRFWTLASDSTLLCGGA